MSWSVGAVGKAPKVAEKLAGQFAGIKCAEPEETIKNHAAAAVAAALAAFPEEAAVSVSANGSQYVPDSKNPGIAINSLNLKIEQIYGFVE